MRFENKKVKDALTIKSKQLVEKSCYNDVYSNGAVVITHIVSSTIIYYTIVYYSTILYHTYTRVC